MKNRVRRVENKKQLHNKIEDFQIQGYNLVEESDRHAKLEMKKYGTLGMHVLWFFLTFWFTFGLGNLGYLIYAYSTKSKSITLKLEDNGSE